jgi:hypothetical protein
MCDSRIFEGPSDSLFIFERDLVRIFGDFGGEALVPSQDFHAFLLHLARHASALHLPQETVEWLASLC